MAMVTIRFVRQAIAADPEARKAKVATRVAAALATVTGLPPSDARIVSGEVEARGWFLGPDSVHALRFENG